MKEYHHVLLDVQFSEETANRIFQDYKYELKHPKQIPSDQFPEESKLSLIDYSGIL